MAHLDHHLAEPSHRLPNLRASYANCLHRDTALKRRLLARIQKGQIGRPGPGQSRAAHERLPKHHPLRAHQV